MVRLCFLPFAPTNRSKFRGTQFDGSPIPDSNWDFDGCHAEQKAYRRPRWRRLGQDDTVMVQDCIYR